MDKRIVKTDAAIYKAFGDCLKEKDYTSISVEDILKKANVSRSTFYAHFKTKDDVLDSLLHNIFHHVFSKTLNQEESHDFSKESVLEYRHLFTHVLYHLKDEEELVRTILGSSCKDRFLDEIRHEMTPLIERVIFQEVFPRKDVPVYLQTSQTMESFIVLIVYWFGNGCRLTPEEMTEFYVVMNS